MTKYYRVIKTVPGFDVGAILKSDGSSYKAINDIFDRFEGASDGLIKGQAVEQDTNSEFFIRVYPIGDKGMFGTKEQAQAAENALYQGDQSKT